MNKRNRGAQAENQNASKKDKGGAKSWYYLMGCRWELTPEYDERGHDIAAWVKATKTSLKQILIEAYEK